MSTRDHISEQDLACLAEGNLRGEREQAVRRHVARCRQCLSDYSEALRARAALLDHPEELPAGDPLVSLGLEIPASASGKPRPLAEPAGRAFRRARSPIAFSVIGVAAVLVLAFVLVPERSRPGGGLTPGDGMTPSDRATLRAEAARLSIEDMVLPGAEEEMSSAAEVNRSLPPEDQERLTATLGRLAAGSTRPGNPESAYWLGVACLAAGRVDAARQTTERGLARFPGDGKLALLDAVVKFHQGDLDRAEERLRAILVARPDDAVARFNLGFLLAETGRNEEARELLDNVKEHASSAALSDRAGAILRRLPSAPARHPR